jgi:hypothetical protein
MVTSKAVIPFLATRKANLVRIVRTFEPFPPTTRVEQPLAPEQVAHSRPHPKAKSKPSAHSAHI